MVTLKQCIEAAGGVPPVAAVCQVSLRAVYKWLAADALPRTEYTGETRHASRIAELAAEKGHPFSTDELLAAASPNKSVA